MSDFKLIQATTIASAYDGEFHWAAAGMGYVIVLPTGRLIVIDGGNREDAENFVTLLESYSDGKPRIAAWLITHPHGDHMDVLYRILTEPALAERVEMGLLFANGPALADEPKLPERLYRPELTEFNAICARFGQNARIPRAGDRYDLDGAALRFFFTQDEIPYQDDYNKMSMVFTLELGGTTVMFTGDAYFEPLQWAVEHFGAALKADICQLAHHGLNGGNPEFYRLVGAKTVMIPSSKSGFLAMRHEHFDNRAAEAIAERMYCAFDGMQEIPLNGK